MAEQQLRAASRVASDVASEVTSWSWVRAQIGQLPPGSQEPGPATWYGMTNMASGSHRYANEAWRHAAVVHPTTPLHHSHASLDLSKATSS